MRSRIINQSTAYLQILQMQQAVLLCYLLILMSKRRVWEQPEGYTNGATVRLSGIADRNDNRVIWYEYNTDGLVSAVRDAHDRRAEYTYTGKLPTSVKDVEGRTTGFTYNGDGKLQTATDALNQTTTIAYDVAGRIQSVLDQQGKGYSFTWNYDKAKDEFYGSYTSTDGKVEEARFDKNGITKGIDTNGRTTRQYLKDGRNYTWIDEKGNETKKDYDEFENLIKVQHPDGATASYEYEHIFNEVTRETNELGVVATYQYDASGNLIRKVEAAGTADERMTEYTYNPDGYLTKEKHSGNAVTAASEINMAYDASGNLLTQTDAEGNTTEFTYDFMGNILTRKDPAGKTTTYTYDHQGNLKTVTDPLQKTTTFTYDGVGNKIMEEKEVNAQIRQTRYEYDQRKHLTKVTDADGKETAFAYNLDGKILLQTDADGRQTNYIYDTDGRLIKTVDGNGNAITNQYDDGATGSGCSSCSGGATTTANLPSRTVFPTFAREFKYDLRSRKTLEKDILSYTDSVATQFTYDNAGNLISKTDKEGKTTTYAYDNLNRLKKVTDPLLQTTEYTYDNRDNLIALKDAKGQTTTFAYDRNNRLIRETRPLQQQTTYQYDTTGRLKTKTDAKGQTITYTYDDAGRMIQIVQTDATGNTKTICFTYDDAGNLLTYGDGATSTTYTYDNLNRKTQETVNYGPFSLTTGYSYNQNGTKKTFTYPNGTVIDYAYDPNNQIAGINITDAGYITIGNYQWTRPTSITLPGGGKREFNYDALMRTQAITGKDPNQNTLLNYSYGFDKMDNIKQRNTQAGNYAYNYDDLYRLSDVQKDTTPTEGYTYDPVGNRLTSQAITGNWSYDANNELISAPPSSGSTGGTTYAYDQNGNTTQRNINGVIQNYVYDVDNRLTEVRDASNNLIATYTYDPFGRRIKKTVSGGALSPSGGGSGEVYYLYADEGLIGEYDSTGNEIKTYGYKPNSTWSTDPIFMKQGTSYYFNHNDHLGTPQKMTDISGTVVWSATYDAFGKAAVDAGSTITNNLRFPGQYYDAETGWHYNWNRYYDPGTGRYVTEDPIGLKSNDVNFYRYVLNNPVNNIDYNGFAYLCAGVLDAYTHFWLCTNNKDCAGLMPHESMCSSSGIVKRAPYKKEVCHEINIPKCCSKDKFEKCIQREVIDKIGSTNDSHYCFPFYTCMGWAWDKVSICMLDACEK